MEVQTTNRLGNSRFTWQIYTAPQHRPLPAIRRVRRTRQQLQPQSKFGSSELSAARVLLHITSYHKPSLVKASWKFFKEYSIHDDEQNSCSKHDRTRALSSNRVRVKDKAQLKHWACACTSQTSLYLCMSQEHSHHRKQNSGSSLTADTFCEPFQHRALTQFGLKQAQIMSRILID
jgi:hypothetical protein